MPSILSWNACLQHSASPALEKKRTSQEMTTLPCTAQRWNSLSVQRITLDAPNQPHGAWCKCQDGFLPHPKAEHQLCSPSTGSVSIPWQRPAAAACTPQLHACHPCHKPSNGPGHQIQPVGFSFLKDLIAGLCSFSQLFVFLVLSHAIGKRLSFTHTQCALRTSVSRNLCTTTFDPGRQL